MKKLRKNGHIYRRKRCSSIMTMHHHIHHGKLNKNWVNWASNCFLIHHILQIWPLPTFSCFHLKKWLGGKRFGSNDEVIVETNAYFEEFDKSYFKEGLLKLEKRWNKCIELKGEMLKNKMLFCQKPYCLFHFSLTYQSTLVLWIVTPGNALLIVSCT